ncbi:MAG: phage tail protein I [Pseudohongiella sp.]|nr:phage tail protein I [Pseudohongiella sp.]
MSDLLPPNVTPLERALSEALDRPLPVIVKQVWNADECPAAILPWLAWAFSVDSWDNSWSDAQKRAVIKASVEVHNIKGTIGALKTALASLGYSIDVIEWFQEGGDPYTFRVNVTLQTEGISSPATYDEIASVADGAKNLRSHLAGVDTTLVMGGTEHFGMACFSGEITDLSPETTTVICNEFAMAG